MQSLLNGVFRIGRPISPPQWVIRNVRSSRDEEYHDVRVPPDMDSYKRFEAEILFFIKSLGHPPASMDSIKSLKLDFIIGQDVKKGGECSICLEGFEDGDFSSKMPCHHKFHWPCIRNWLRVRGMCPLCRYRMPVDKKDLRKIIFRYGGGFGGDSEENRERRRIWRAEHMGDNLERFFVMNGPWRDRIEYDTDQTSNSGE